MTGSGLSILIIGRQGQIAWELQRSLLKLGQVRALGRPEIDLLQPATVANLIRQTAPDVVVNAAAYTAVDQAETEPEIAAAVNAQAPRIMAQAAKDAHALFITYSTDYVFEGSKTSAYTESDRENPLNVYGASKLAGDRGVQEVDGDHLILRTSWVYGPRGKNFLLTIMRLALEREELRVVNDQIGAPTSSEDIADATRQILQQVAVGLRVDLGNRRGIYNMTAQGSVSWYGFANAIVEEMRARNLKSARLAKIVPISTNEFPAAAVRPKNSMLSNEKIRAMFGIRLPDWRVSMVKTMRAMETPEAAEVDR